MPTHPLRDTLRQAEADLTAGRPGEALRRCNDVLATWPRWLEAQRVAAEAHLALGEFPQAEMLLDTILSVHPEHVRAYCDRAYLALLRGDQAGALACYRRACELSPDDEQLRGSYQRLASQLSRPSFTPSHTGLARMLARSDLFTHALREWDIALNANPRRLDAQIGMAETLWRMGDARRSESVCRYIINAMPECLKPTLLLALFELNAGHADEANRLVQTATQFDPEHAIAGELFADQVAAGNIALAQLFRSNFRANTSPLALAGQPLATTTPSTPISNTTPLFTRAASESLPTSKMMPSPSQTHANGSSTETTVEDFFSRSRASMVPDDFEYVFRETEYMLWSRDQEEANTAEIPTTPEDVIRKAKPPVEPETVAPPDGDADMRYVRWLQSQGARPLDPNASFSPEMSVAAEEPPVETPPFLQQAFQEEPATAELEVPMPSPLPEPSIEIEPETTTVDLPVVVVASEHVPEALSPTVPVFEAPREEAQPTEPITIVEPEPIASESPAADTLETVTPAQGFDPLTSAGAGPLTIEAIEQGLASAGFSHHETGRLAAMLTLSEQEPVEIAPNPTEAISRLESARTLRRTGRMGEALTDYRVLVKSATEHLDEVIRDLRDAAIEDSREPEIFRLLGDAYIRRGDYVEALEAYNRASALRSQS